MRVYIGIDTYTHVCCSNAAVSRCGTDFPTTGCYKTKLILPCPGNKTFKNCFFP